MENLKENTLHPAGVYIYHHCMNILEVLQVICAILLIICITVQHRASGLSSTFGGSGASLVVQRRGAERLIFNATIWLSVIFFALSIVRWYVY